MVTWAAKPEIVEKTFVSPDGKKVTKKVELFTWEKLDYVTKLLLQPGLWKKSRFAGSIA